jgi:hypothetical protein
MPKGRLGGRSAGAHAIWPWDVNPVDADFWQLRVIEYFPSEIKSPRVYGRSERLGSTRRAQVPRGRGQVEARTRSRPGRRRGQLTGGMTAR